MLRPPTVDFESLTLTALFILRSEYLRTFLEIIDDIPRNVWQHSPECLRTFTGMFGDIPRGITIPLFPAFPHSVPRFCIPGFKHSRGISMPHF